jgi:dihydrolipoamide dehydrogenase
LEDIVMDTKTYDVTVIGSGPGGYVAAIRAAQHGLAVLVVERDAELGGVCTLRGCIPTKALLHTADLLEETRRGSALGVAAADVRLDWAAASSFRKKVVRQSTNGVSFLFRKNKIDVARGWGSLTTPHRVRVVTDEGAETHYETKNVILATGTVPRPLPAVDFDGERVISSDHVLDLPSVPESMIVLGAGAVGVEFASMYARFGTRVSVIEAQEHLLPIEDEDISKELERSFRRQRIETHLGARVVSVEKTDSGVTALAQTADGSHATLVASKLLVAIGRTTLVDHIGLSSIGVATSRGRVDVDPYMRTSVPGVYAVGDIVATPALAHVAEMEGVVAADTIAGKNPEPVAYDAIPNCTYSMPEIASVGLTEKAARERGHEVRIGSFPFAASGKGRILGRIDGFVKVVTDVRHGKVLGVHMIGPRVTELVAEATLAVQLGTTAKELAHTVHAHPTLSEVLREAAEGALGAQIHL